MTLHGLLVRLLLPPDFVAEFGDEMEATFRATLRKTRRGRRARLWLREGLDLVRTGAREWSERLRERAQPTHQENGGDGRMASIMRDLRFALRTLRRQPGFTAVVVLTLGLGIGANTAIFGVVDAVLLEALPYREPERLVTVWEDVTARGGPATEWFNFEDFRDLSEEPGLFAAAATWGGWQPTLRGPETPEIVSGVIVGEKMLDEVLGAEAALGRMFGEADDVPGAPAVVVLSYRSWQNRFRGDPAVLGRTLVLTETPFTVVGVAPPGFRFPFAPDAEVFAARGSFGAPSCLRGCFGTRVIARMPPGPSLEGVQARAREVGARLAAAYPDTNTGMTFNVVSLRNDLTGASARPLWILLGSVAFVLLIACTNVANLLLSRASARRTELAVRAALGAGRASVIRQLLVESLVLATLGGAAGLLLAVQGTRMLQALAPDGALPRLDEVGLDARVLGFTLVTTLVTAILFGLVPAWRATRADVHDAVRAGRMGTGGGQRLRSGLAIFQVASAVVLLIGAGLLLRSFQRLDQVDLGFQPDGVLTLSLNLPASRYADGPERQTFYYDLLDRLRAVPGVEGAAIQEALPLAGQDGDADFLVEGAPPPGPGVNQAAWIRRMSEGYFEVMGMELASGRSFNASDDAEAPRVVVVNETLAERFYGGDAVGKRLAFGSDPEQATWRTIVGVARDVRHFGLRQPARPAAYLPYRQISSAQMSVVVRTEGDPSALVPAVRTTVADLDPGLAAAQVRPLSELVDFALAPDRFVALLLAIFAGTALLLAAVGIYGVISYGVARRMREMGIRIALGAHPGEVRRLVVRGGMTLAGTGLLVGVAGALGLTRFVAGLLFEVEPTDPTTFLSTVGLLAAVAWAGSWLPARRAGRADPVTVLRED